MKLSMSVFLSFFLIFMACSGDDDDDIDQVDCNGASIYTSNVFLEVNMELSEASSTYGNDPTPENCEAFKNTYLDYIDALRSLRDCAEVYGQIEEYDASLDQAEQSIDDLEC